MNNEIVISTIQKYIDECLFQPASNWPKYYFKERSYSIWAGNEIIRLIKEDSLPYMLAINEFINKMDYFSGINEDTDPSYIFINARCAAEEILNLFL